MIHPPPHLPLRAQVGWLCTYTRMDESTPPAVFTGKLARAGVFGEGADMAAVTNIIADTLAHR